MLDKCKIELGQKYSTGLFPKMQICLNFRTANVTPSGANTNFSNTKGPKSNFANIIPKSENGLREPE